MTISCTPEDLETLRLLALAGSAGASRALEEMTGLRVAFEEPRLGPVGVEAATRLIGEEQVEVVALLLDIVEDLPAALLITFAPDTARRLLATMLPPASLLPDEIPEIHRSGLIEVGNVLGAAYANALAAALHQAVRPAVPSLAVDMAGAVAADFVAAISDGAPTIFLVETAMRFPGTPADDTRDRILLAPEGRRLRELLDSLRVSNDE